MNEFWFGDPAKHVSNPLFRLWKFIDDRGVHHPTTPECAAHMGVSIEQVKTMLKRIARYVHSTRTPRATGRWAQAGAQYNTWGCFPWTTAMTTDPFPKPRGWKPVRTNLSED